MKVIMGVKTVKLRAYVVSSFRVKAQPAAVIV